MENRRRQNWDRNRRSQNRRPPRGTCNWQPTVPSWEKEFCRVVGSLEWETLLQMKKFMHLYGNVLNWNDSEGEEAFSNAKKRFWAEINGLPCDISLPDRDRYIDTIDWDSEIDYGPYLELEPVISNPDDPVIIFGDSLLPNQAYSISGWGDDEENFKLPADSSLANDHGAQWEQNWGDSFANNSSANNPGAQWEQNWGDSFNDKAPIGWSGDSNNACQFGDEDGWNNDCGWNNDNNNMVHKVGPDIEHKVVDGEQGQWNDDNFKRGNIGRHVSSDRTWRVQGQDRHRNHNTSRNHHNGRQKTTHWGQQQSAGEKRQNPSEWNSYTSCGPVSHNAAITVGQKWNR